MERLPAPAQQGWVPAADLCETADAYIVTAELPGVPRPQIRIDVHDGQLTVHGRRDARVACEQYHQVERGHGEFSRSFRLPHTIVAERISAELKDGVLTIVVPKGQPQGPRRVDVVLGGRPMRRLSLALRPRPGRRRRRAGRSRAGCAPLERSRAAQAAGRRPARPATRLRLPPSPATGPDFTRVAEQTTGAVTNIASLQVVRRQASPFANDPFFQYFFGGADDMFGSRNRYESSLGSGVVISADGYVLTNSHVVGEGAGRGHRRPRRQARAARQGDRRRRLHRPGAAQGRGPRPADDSLGRLGPAEGRRVGAGDRQPVPVEPDGHAGHRQRARPGQRRHRRLRGLHPDRRRDQPGQLGRRAHQRPRRAHRHQHRDLLAERRLPGHRLRRAEQPRPPRRRRPDQVRRGAARVDRLPRGRRRSPRGWPTSCGRRPPTAWW